MEGLRAGRLGARPTPRALQYTGEAPQSPVRRDTSIDFGVHHNKGLGAKNIVTCYVK